MPAFLFPLWVLVTLAFLIIGLIGQAPAPLLGVGLPFAMYQGLKLLNRWERAPFWNK